MNRFLIFTFSIFTILTMYNAQHGKFSERVFITSCIIQVISIVFIFSKEKQPYSLNKIFYLFSLFFFGIAPLIQFYEGGAFFGARLLLENEIYYMNILIILILLFYQAFYTLFYKLYRDKKSYPIADKFLIKKKLDRLNSFKLLLISVLSFVFVLYTVDFNIFNLLLRGGELTSRNENSQNTAVNLIIIQVVRPLTMMCLYFYLISSSKNLVLGIVLFSLALVSIFPTGVPRFYAAAMYIPLLLVTVPFLRRKNIFSISLVLGLLIIYPLLNYFREFASLEEVKFSLNYQMFNTGHFDSYQNFALIVIHDFFTAGYQLVGVLLFFVPRSIWSSKPVGSGEYIATELNFYFKNISANYFAEGYINFGFIGILCFIVILAFLTARIDKLYWNYIVYYKDNFLRVGYMIMLGMLFFILRGDLLSSFAFTVGFFVSYFIILLTIKLK